VGDDSILKQMLIDGLDKLGLDTGIISHIVGNTYTVYLCESKDIGIPTGTEFELADTYCSDVIAEGKTKYYRDVAKITAMLKHPCYLNTQLRAYIGTPLRVGGQIWGTLNYSSLSPHKLEYSEEEIAFLEQQAQTVSSLLEHLSVTA